MYDITSSASLVKAKSWIAELQRQADPGIVVLLAGNKLDLEPQRQVSTEEAQKYAAEEGLLFCEVSAKSAEGVKGLFDQVAGKMTLDLPSARTQAKPRGGVDLVKQGAAGREGCAC